MRQLLTILLLLFLCGCKREFRKTVDTYSDGKIKTEFVYTDKNDTLNYSIFDYYSDGKILFHGIVENGKFVGVKRSYYDNGNPNEIDSIVNPCILSFCCCDGKVYKYYRNGKLNQTYENRNGVANGLVTLYTNDSTEALDEVRTYKDGKRNGAFKSFFKSGKVYSIGTYKNDSLVDYIYYFHENGDTSKYFYHFKGKQDFPAKKWLANGQVFYATYTDTTYDKALFRWTDKNGKELKRQIVTPDENKHFIVPE